MKVLLVLSVLLLGLSVVLEAQDTLQLSSPVGTMADILPDLQEFGNILEDEVRETTGRNKRSTISRFGIFKRFSSKLKKLARSLKNKFKAPKNIIKMGNNIGETLLSFYSKDPQSSCSEKSTHFSCSLTPMVDKMKESESTLKPMTPTTNPRIEQSNFGDETPLALYPEISWEQFPNKVKKTSGSVIDKTHGDRIKKGNIYGMAPLDNISKAPHLFNSWKQVVNKEDYGRTWVNETLGPKDLIKQGSIHDKDSRLSPIFEKYQKKVKKVGSGLKDKFCAIKHKAKHSNTFAKIRNKISKKTKTRGR